MLRNLITRIVLLKAGGVAISGWLLACAFPLPPGLEGLEGAGAAWMALIPLLLVVRASRPRAAFAWGWASGFLFWLLTLSWLLALRHTWGGVAMPTLGWIALSAYCALYTGLFAFVLAAVPDKWRLLPVLAAPILWAGTEWLRATLFSGFPWNPLGVSQHTNIAAIQIAGLGGVYAVSALIVLLNAALAMTILRVYGEIRNRQARRRRVHSELMVGLTAVAVCWSWGVRSVRQGAKEAAGPTLRVAAIQPAIPQLQKWNEAHEHEINKALGEKTELAMMSRPDLIVWPETATPGMMRIDPLSQRLIESVAAQGEAYLLAGSMDYRQLPGQDPQYLNASFLVSTNGQVKAVYNKRHLVLFGEYLPFENQLPFMKRWSPLGFSCVRGEPDQPLMELATPATADHPPVALSVLICFEDVFPYLARRDVRRGARLLVNQTNDAWFDGSAASRQHMANAVLRTVENRVPMVRAANTGISCFIDRFGRIIKCLPGHGHGYLVDELGTSSADMPLTPYTRKGDWLFGLPCALATVLAAFWCIRGSCKNAALRLLLRTGRQSEAEAGSRPS
jgi:apolipoprotein N-acyltransferase